MIALFGTISAIQLNQRVADEVDDLLEKQDKKDEEEIQMKEFNDAGSKMNQIGAMSKQH